MADLERIMFGNGKVDVEISYGVTRPPAIERISPSGSEYRTPETFACPQSMVQITADGFMQENFGSRYSETLIGNNLRYAGHRIVRGDGEKTLEVAMRAESYGLRVFAYLTLPDDAAAVRSSVTVCNEGDRPVTLTSVSSLSAYVRLGMNDAETWDVVSGRSDWLAEGRWRREPVRDYELVRLLGVDSASVNGEISPTLTPYGPTMTRSSTSSRTTCSTLPAGALVDRASSEAMFWQIEAMAPWLWQVGERVDGFYLLLSGPTDIEHHWSRTLEPGEVFETASAAVSVSSREFDGALAEMTRYRRHVVRPHDDHKEMPVVFNDYMNTLMGDPTTAKEIPLIDAAAAVGAEYYCVDCGWYDDGADWWPSVGAWRESRTRFPGGLKRVFDHIRERGMKPGIWLEPEVIGVKSPVAGSLPEDAFMHRDGKRIQTHLRYHLDLRSSAARKHLDDTVDRLVDEYGVRFFKLDYNINAGAGSDNGGSCRGDGLLESGRAYVRWLSDVLDRHPGLTVETCSSGSMRSDPLLLTQSQLQSTSDQQDFRQYANIAASSPAMMLPEQCGNWAYPNKAMSEAETRFTMLNGLVGRLYLSGYLTEMSDNQVVEVSHALEVYKIIRKDIARSVPFWPLGMPRWRDDVVALGLLCDDGAGYLAIWFKKGLHKKEHIDIREMGFSSAEFLYGSKSAIEWNREEGRLSLSPEGATGSEGLACALVRLRAV